MADDDAVDSKPSSPSATYTLYYFNCCGIAEPIRYLLHYCGIPFRDLRLNYTDQWLPSLKAEMPMERLPVLEINGVKYHQHLPICRYIARKNRLYWGTDEEEILRTEAIAEDLNDIRITVGNYYKEHELKARERLKTEALDGLKFYLSRFEEQIAKNDGFFVGTKVSWVDIYCAAIMESMSELLHEDVCQDYPSLKNMCTRIRTHMMIAPYLKKRPKSDIEIYD